jgi:phosphoglycolate phosphatase
MPTYRLAIFDFDGTLADSFRFFAGVFNALAARHGFRPIDPDAVEQYRGASPREMMAHVGLPAWKLPFVARDFMACMRANRGAIALFDGVGEVLQVLAARGVRLALVSSNAEDNVRAVLGEDNARLFGHFECGMSIFGKAARIGRTLHEMGVPRDEAICIGDQVPDLEAARKVGVAFGAVAWGYATIESLRAHAPDEEFAQVADLLRLAA